MKKHPVVVIVNFCTNETRFIRDCLEQALLFSEQVIVPVCDHFFDGTPENRSLLESIYSAFPACHFVEYPFIVEKISQKTFRSVDPSHFWHSLSRLIGMQFVAENMESVLFLDADEIPDGRRFAQWLQWNESPIHTVLKFANYWYFREPSFQATEWEDSIVWAQRKALSPGLLLRQEEREAIYDLLPGPKRRQVVGVDGTPMFHHYSWVRTEEEMLQKVRSWGHRKDRDWESLVKKEFTSPFQGTDFVHGYRLQKVPPAFSIPDISAPFSSQGKPHITRLTAKEVMAAVRLGRGSFWDKIFG